MSAIPSAPDFTSRLPIQFICDANPTLSITASNNNLLYNNPKIYQLSPGLVTKIDLGLNGTQYLMGDGEYAPVALDMQWDELGWNDYLNLAALRPYTVTFISHRNNGFLGKLLMDKPKNTGGRTADVVACAGKFLVIAPSDDGPNGVGGAGAANTINRISTTLMNGVVTSGAAGSGFIPANAQNYYWVTFSSIWGETSPQASGLITSTNANIANTITFSWPTSTTYCIKASIYVGGVNDPTQSRLLAELLNGDTPIWKDLVGFPGTVVNQQPPSVNTAYRGLWQSGVWANETP